MRKILILAGILAVCASGAAFAEEIKEYRRSESPSCGAKCP